jgi:hypothetical protein
MLRDVFLSQHYDCFNELPSANCFDEYTLGQRGASSECGLDVEGSWEHFADRVCREASPAELGYEKEDCADWLMVPRRVKVSVTLVMSVKGFGTWYRTYSRVEKPSTDAKEDPRVHHEGEPKAKQSDM